MLTQINQTGANFSQTRGKCAQLFNVKFVCCNRTIYNHICFNFKQLSDNFHPFRMLRNHTSQSLAVHNFFSGWNNPVIIDSDLIFLHNVIIQLLHSLRDLICPLFKCSLWDFAIHILLNCRKLSVYRLLIFSQFCFGIFFIVFNRWCPICIC